MDKYLKGCEFYDNNYEKNEKRNQNLAVEGWSY